MTERNISSATLKQPKGLRVLFFAEMWERFGFYCVQAILVLFLTKAHHYSDSQAYSLFTAFSALIFTTPIIGGFIADRLIGYRYAILLGGILYTLGYFALATSSPKLFYLALALQICGNGFFKGCISCLLGTLYDTHDPRRDSGFTLFYMGINIGAFTSPLVCGWVADQWGWAAAFGLAGVGMLIGVITTIVGFRRFGEKGLPPNKKKLLDPYFLGFSQRTFFLAAVIIAILIVSWMIQYPNWVNYITRIFSMIMAIAILILAFRYPKTERKKIFLLVILTGFSILFWAIYTQCFSSLTLFTDRIVNRNIFGFTIPAAMYQAINPFFIITLSPLLARLWLHLNINDLNPSIPMKFALGILFLALGFLVLPIGIYLANQQGIVSQFWLTFSYFLQTTGELCLSPIGLAMVTALAPRDLMGFMMGVWFLCIALGYSFGDYIANLASIPATITDIHAMSAIYKHVFFLFGFIALGVGIFLVALTPLLKRLTQ